MAIWMVVFGLWGNNGHFRSLRKRISRNESYGGTDGVAVIALLLIFGFLDLIEENIDVLIRTHHTLNYVQDILPHRLPL